ncbi:MAG: hypothetical protein MJZ58_01840 [Paludibacteraceae bacterium]|nr:hypothetical protein [Paludibacteraceae bacterium]
MMNEGYIEIGGERFYRIERYNEMKPFFISLASESDLWMYIGSTGGLTCGRVNPDQALFPYYTDDKVIENYVHTGPQTCINGWHPFRSEAGTVAAIAKNVTGNKLLFSERNEALGLEFSYLWTSSDEWGWIRKVMLRNLTGKPMTIRLSDKLTNILPAGVNRQTQNVFSTLVDGYKRTEHVAGTGLVLFRMEAIMVDRAEPSESLRCNTGWVAGWDSEAIVPKDDLLGVRGEMGVETQFELTDSKSWYFVLDVEKDVAAVKLLMGTIAKEDIAERLEQAISRSTQTLYDIVAANDGLQSTGDVALDARHFANVLFNTMRGGYFCDQDKIHKDAFLAHVRNFYIKVYEDSLDFLNALPETFTLADLTSHLSPLNSKLSTLHSQLKRLCLCYLPLTFSRRHGDPSRPWNSFAIRVKDSEGKRLLAWQGNWRDIFQNWEALCTSYPYYTNSVIATFLNATTADGYNPYRITSEGIDWEVIEKDNPWSNIGYWGDHQIIYLCKLIELSLRHDAKALRAMANEPIFSFANVPYRIKRYREIVADPKHSITFDDELHQRIMALIPTYGQDARLLLDESVQPVLATLMDKLLITLLTKMSNLIPNVGIWMNTLRPEWNDANNALVGNGASVVTLCYMHRFVEVVERLIGEEADGFTIYKDVYTFLQNILNSLNQLNSLNSPKGALNSQCELLGLAGEHYRTAAYTGLSKERVTIGKEELLKALAVIKHCLRSSIEANKREDGLWHTYNIIHFSPLTGEPEGASPLYLMLEGQVAVLSSGVLSGTETLALLKALRASELYCPRRNSYMLYPQRRLPSFLEKNRIEWTKEQGQRIKDAGVVVKDCDGEWHWNADFRNASVLREYMERKGIAEDEIRQAEELYEQTFNHKAFTGRSGTFYKYEGLGSIYWHMVSKLQLAVAENIVRFEQEDPSVVPALVGYYRDIREGVGAHKSAADYGAFPFDPYSHTPFFAGAQQPGMTGQVKEDILSRFIELGIREQDGEITLSPTMLQDIDSTHNPLTFTFRGKEYTINK